MHERRDKRWRSENSIEVYKEVGGGCGGNNGIMKEEVMGGDDGADQQVKDIMITMDIQMRWQAAKMVVMVEV